MIHGGIKTSEFSSETQRASGIERQGTQIRQTDGIVSSNGVESTIVAKCSVEKGQLSS